MTRPWMIDELAHAGSEHLDPWSRGSTASRDIPIRPGTSPRGASMASAGRARWWTLGPGRDGSPWRLRARDFLWWPGRRCSRPARAAAVQHVAGGPGGGDGPVRRAAGPAGRDGGRGVHRRGRGAVAGWGGQRAWGTIGGRIFAALTDTEGVVISSRRSLLRRCAGELDDLRRVRAQLRAVEAEMVAVLAELGLSRLGDIPGLTAVGAAAGLGRPGGPGGPARLMPSACRATTARRPAG